MVTLILVVSFIFFVIIGIPIAFVLGLTPLVALISQGETPLVLVAQQIFTGMDNPILMAIPFFYSGRKPHVPRHHDRTARRIL